MLAGSVAMSRITRHGRGALLLSGTLLWKRMEEGAWTVGFIRDERGGEERYACYRRPAVPGWRTVGNIVCGECKNRSLFALVKLCLTIYITIQISIGFYMEESCLFLTWNPKGLTIRGISCGPRASMTASLYRPRSAVRITSARSATHNATSARSPSNRRKPI